MAADVISAVALFFAVSFLRLGEDWLAEWRRIGIQPGLAAALYGGGWLAVQMPRNFDARLLFYRSDLCTTPPQTWDELVEAARKLNDPSANVYGLAFSAKGNEEGTFQFLPWIQMGGGSYDNVNGLLNFFSSVVTEAALSYVRTLEHAGEVHVQSRRLGITL